MAGKIVFRILFLFILFLSSNISSAQGQDYTWWNQAHGWEPGMKGWRMWLILSPGYLGPNALPVPELKQAVIPAKGEFEFGANLHFKSGDPTQDISARCLIPFANNRIAIEMYGVILEKYQMSETIRDERFARDYDGKGFVQGDLYFSTLIQLSKGKKFPDAMVRFTCKTTSGGGYNAARTSDSPGYFFDVNFSKDIKTNSGNVWIPVSMLGFYSWQTNDELNLQNDAFLYGAGLHYKSGKWLVSSTLSGYHGYKKNGDRPMVYTTGIKRDVGNKTFRIQYLHGFNDWDYDTFKVSLIWYFKGPKNAG